MRDSGEDKNNNNNGNVAANIPGKKKALGCCDDVLLCCPTFLFLFLASLNINFFVSLGADAGSRTMAEKRHLTNEGLLCNIYFLNLHSDSPENKFKLIFAFALFPSPLSPSLHWMCSFVSWNESLFIARKTDLICCIIFVYSTYQLYI